MRHYRPASKLVRAGLTTWEALEKAGRAAPLPVQTKEWFLDVAGERPPSIGAENPATNVLLAGRKI